MPEVTPEDRAVAEDDAEELGEPLTETVEVAVAESENKEVQVPVDEIELDCEGMAVIVELREASADTDRFGVTVGAGENDGEIEDTGLVE